MIWMAIAAAWTVALYMRSQRPAWLTLGAGARIGLVTGLLAGWLAFGVSGGALFVQRFLLHQSSQIDAQWKYSADASNQAALQMIQQWSSWMTAEDVAKLQANQAGIHAMMLTPEGQAGNVTLDLIFSSVFLLLFAAAGGALGARLSTHVPRPEV
jgi:anti-sigma factor RsiW